MKQATGFVTSDGRFFEEEYLAKKHQDELDKAENTLKFVESVNRLCGYRFDPHSSFIALLKNEPKKVIDLINKHYMG